MQNIFEKGVKMSIEAKELIKKAENYYEEGIYEGTIENFKKVYAQDPDLLTEENKEHFAKAIYEFSIRDSTFMTPKLDGSLIFLTRLVSQKDTTEGQECVYTDAVMTVVGFGKNQYEAIVKWYKKLDPSLLNPNPSKKNSYSDRDRWYSHSTRALLDAKKYKQCIELSNEALEKIDYIMNDDEAWFKRRIGLSYKALGDSDLAIKYLEEVLKVKVNWHNGFYLAEAYYANGQVDKALKMALKAALMETNAEPRQKKYLYIFLKNLFYEKGFMEEYKHISDLIYTIKFNWNTFLVDDEDEDYLEFLKELDQDKLDVVSLEEELRKEWKKLLDEV